MRSIDLTPLYRTSVGFDRLANMLDTLNTAGDMSNGYPPYNIEKTGETDYRITLAVAGFTEDDISIETKQGELVVAASKSPVARNGAEAAEQPQILYRGIAERSFERRFKLADHVRATGAKLENGLLHVDLVREIPEALKPRRIPVRNVDAPRVAAE